MVDGRPFGQPAGRATPRASLCGESRPFGDHQAQGASSISMTWPEYRRRECRIDGNPVSLKQQDADVLLLFLIRRGEIIPHIDIIEMLWPNPDAAPDYETDCCRTLVSRLRRTCGITINVEWGRGYCLPLPSPPVEQREAA